MASSVPVLQDERYIRVNGKPLLLVYRTELLPDPARTAEVWREEARAAGLGELFLGRVESFSKCDPAEIGFDGCDGEIVCERRRLGADPFPAPRKEGPSPVTAAPLTSYRLRLRDRLLTNPGPLSTRRRGGDKPRASPLAIAWRGDLGVR